MGPGNSRTHTVVLTSDSNIEKLQCFSSCNIKTSPSLCLCKYKTVQDNKQAAWLFLGWFRWTEPGRECVLLPFTPRLRVYAEATDQLSDLPLWKINCWCLWISLGTRLFWSSSFLSFCLTWDDNKLSGGHTCVFPAGRGICPDVNDQSDDLLQHFHTS